MCWGPLGRSYSCAEWWRNPPSALCLERWPCPRLLRWLCPQSPSLPFSEQDQSQEVIYSQLLKLTLMAKDYQMDFIDILRAHYVTTYILKVIFGSLLPIPVNLHAEWNKKCVRSSWPHSQQAPPSPHVYGSLARPCMCFVHEWLCEAFLKPKLWIFPFLKYPNAVYSYYDYYYPLFNAV